MKKKGWYLVWLLLPAAVVFAQQQRPWNGKKCAVVLTYDDGLNVHLKNALPALDSAGLKGTFYLSDNAGNLKQQLPYWKKAAARGHELANHTLFHPCEGGQPGREFVTPDYDLNNYTVRRITDEIRAMNNLLYAVDGREKRTFAFPCNDTKIHDTAYLQYSQKDFISARAVRSEMPAIDKVDLYNVPSYMISGQSGKEMIALVKEAVQKGGLLVFLFHGVGGEHGLDVSLPAHSQLLHYLKTVQREVWVAPMREVASWIKAKHPKNKK